MCEHKIDAGARRIIRGIGFMELTPYFHLTFRPNIKLVSTVRRFIGDFYRRILNDVDLSSRLALATHELLENAVAYAAEQETSIRIEIEGDQLIIKTWNRTTAERMASLKKRIDNLREIEDADTYYQQMLVSSLKQTDTSGLGLARIRAEADMKLSYEIEGDKVCIRASAPIVGGLIP